MNNDQDLDIASLLQRLAQEAPSRETLWVELARQTRIRRMAEIGVFRGVFAAAMLNACPGIDRYYLIDPWKHLAQWNKPANVDNRMFEDYYREALAATAFAAQRRVVLRGTTCEVIVNIQDDYLDLAYIDGDHTLRGIAIDLMRCYAKVAHGGLIGGDDFCPTIWQHAESYEPSMVFPYAVYFAEAVGARIYALPFNQFVIHKSSDGFAFTDLTGKYRDTQLRKQILIRPARRRFASLRRLREAFRRPGS